RLVRRSRARSGLPAHAGQHGPLLAMRPYCMAQPSGGQTLFVLEGHGLVQSRGGNVIQILPGDVIYTPAGEEHWHGAAPDHFMTHLALWEVDGDGNSAIWGDQVTDDEYRAAPAQRA